jgi:polyphosphate kinase
VLAQATDSTVPLLERLRFMAIFASNLDEFFMVRVAGLKQQAAAGVTATTPDGRTPEEQLAAVSERLRPLLASAAEVLHDQLLPLLARHDVALWRVADLDADEQAHLDREFDEDIFPVLTPLAVDPGHPFPYISNLSLSLAVTVRHPDTGQHRFARVKVPSVLPRFLALLDGASFVPLEDVIESRLDRLFPGMEVLEASPFRVTRNSDIDLEEEEADDLLMAMERTIRRRRFGAVVRLEVADTTSEETVAKLCEELDVDDRDLYRTSGLLGLDDLAELADLDRSELHWPRWEPVTPPAFARSADVFSEIRAGDVLVHHPYESFERSVGRFIEEASADPQVLAIKQTVYRTSGDSPIVHALIRAAEAGKGVVALVELKARFDEEANIRWARALEKAGVHVVYGLVGLKTHSKTSLVVRRDDDGIRRYVHLGTGNYNPQTAGSYTDIGLFTCDDRLGADLTDLFNVLTGYARQERYRELMVAPTTMRADVASLIRREIETHQRGERPGSIRLKLNGLLDPALVRELYEASRVGVRVDLLVRGICALRPEVPGVSDRIRVISVVGRLLEHSRIWQFGPDGLWIGSADWMPRNLDRRVELMAPVCDPDLRDELAGVLDLVLADNVQAWRLCTDGSWVRRFPGDGDHPVDSQALLMARARARATGEPDPAAHLTDQIEAARR